MNKQEISKKQKSRNKRNENKQEIKKKTACVQFFKNIYLCLLTPNRTKNQVIIYTTMMTESGTN